MHFTFQRAPTMVKLTWLLPWYLKLAWSCVVSDLLWTRSIITRKWRYVLTLKRRCHHFHDDVIKWKHFPCYWPFVRGIHRSPANSPHKGHRRGALMFTLICVWINGCVNNCKAGDQRRYCAHYGVTVMLTKIPSLYAFEFDIFRCIQWRNCIKMTTFAC